MKSIATFKNVSKNYKNGVAALKNISFEIEDDKIIGLLGRNGAGKTSLINILMGFIPQSSGDVQVFDQKPGTSCLQIGYVPDFPHFHQRETVFKLLVLLAKMHKIERNKQRPRCLEVIEKFGLGSFADRPLSQLSKGMLQRFSIAQAMLNDPDLLIMDEPLSGLDPLGQSEMIDLILRLNRPGRTVLVSSHLLFHLDRICDQVLILDSGTRMFYGKPSGALNEFIIIKFIENLTDEHLHVFVSLGAQLLNEKEIEIKRGNDVFHIMRYCADQRIEIESLKCGKKSLEQLFLNLIKSKA